MAPSISYTGTGQLPLGYNGSYTWTGVNIGAADSGRLIIVSAYADNANVGGNPTPSACTIGGITATRLHHSLRSTGNNAMAIAYFAAYVPTGTTADISVTYTDFGYVGVIEVFRCLEVLPTVLNTNSFHASADAALDTSVVVPSGSNLVLSSVIYQGCSFGTNISWSNVNEISESNGYNFSKRFGNAYFVDASAGTRGLYSSISPTVTSEGLIIGLVLSGLNAYTLTADTSSFTFTGQNLGLIKTSKLTSDSVTFNLQSYEPELLIQRVLPSETADFVLNGQPSNLIRTISPLTAETTSVSISGQTAGLFNNRTLVGEPSSFVLNGQDAVLGSEKLLQSETGQFNLTLVDGQLKADRFISSETTTFTSTFNDSLLYKTHILSVDTGAFSLSAPDAYLDSQKTLTTITATYELSFSDVTLQKDTPLTAETGVFTITGSDIGTAQVRCPTLNLDLTTPVPQFVGQAVVNSALTPELSIFVEKLTPTISVGYNAQVPAFELALAYGANYYKVQVISTTGGDAPASHIADSKELDGDAYVDLFEITLSDKSSRLFFKEGKDGVYQGNTYEGTGIKIEGVGKYADDEVARPKLTLFNPDGVFSSLIDQQLLDSAQITRIRVLKDDYDNDRPVYRRQRWRVSRTASLRKGIIGLELRDMLDGQNFLTPGRMFIPPDFPAVSIS